MKSLIWQRNKIGQERAVKSLGAVASLKGKTVHLYGTFCQTNHKNDGDMLYNRNMEISILEMNAETIITMLSCNTCLIVGILKLSMYI